MFQNRFKIFTRRAKKIRLSKTERDATERELLAYMRANPMQQVRNSGVMRQLLQKGPNHSLTQKPMLLKPTAIALMAVLLLGVGTSYAAEQALPGDTLYPVKTEVNERVRGAFTFSEEGKARWESNKAGRRLGEFAQLRTRDGRVSEEMLSHLQEKFDQHAQRVQERIVIVREKYGDEKANALADHFAHAVQYHEEVIERLSDGTVDQEDIDAFRAHVQERQIQMKEHHDQMRTFHQEVRAQVESGEISKDEARTKWQEWKMQNPMPFIKHHRGLKKGKVRGERPVPNTEPSAAPTI